MAQQLIPRYMFNAMCIVCSPKGMYEGVHNSIIHNKPKLETSPQKDTVVPPTMDSVHELTVNEPLLHPRA